MLFKSASFKLQKKKKKFWRIKLLKFYRFLKYPVGWTSTPRIDVFIVSKSTGMSMENKN